MGTANTPGNNPGNDTVLYDVTDGIAVVTLNRPHAANTIDPSLSQALGAAMERADADADVRAIVLTGAGEKIFCAGMDLRAFADVKEGEHLSIDPRFLDLLRVGPRKPLIAAVNGAAVGGGFEIMLACDMAVVAEHARFGVPEVKVGMLPGGGGTLLTRRMPRALAYELVLTGDLVPAARVLELGLANAVVPGPEVVATALALARKVGANAPLAVQGAKKALRVAAESDTAAGWAAVDEAMPAVAGSADALEGAKAFTEKRAPNWTGR